MTLQPAQGEGLGEQAARLCGAAVQLLGWRPAEFWEATPAELATALQADGALVEPETLAELMRRFPHERDNHG